MTVENVQIALPVRSLSLTRQAKDQPEGTLSIQIELGKIPGMEGNLYLTMPEDHLHQFAEEILDELKSDFERNT